MRGNSSHVLKIREWMLFSEIRFHNLAFLSRFWNCCKFKCDLPNERFQIRCCKNAWCCSKDIVQYRCFHVYISQISHIFLIRYTLSVFISPQQKFHFNQVRLLLFTRIGLSYSLQKNHLTMSCFSDHRKINFWISRKNKPDQNKAIVVLNFKSIKSKFICSIIKFRVPI